MPDPPSVGIPFTARGPLDTANPVTALAPGAIVVAKDLHPRWWGPRVGSRAFTRVWESPGTAALYDEITLDGSSSSAIGRSYEDQFRDLGTEFTIDLWFRLTDSAYAAASDAIGLYSFILTSSGGYVDIGLYGPNHAKALKPFVNIVTNPTRTTTDSLVTFDGSTAIVAGSSQQHKYHVRLVRSGATATLYVDGSSHGSTSSLVATSPIFANAGTTGDVYLGFVTQTVCVTLKGQVLAAVLRDGAYESSPIAADLPADPWAPCVHHYYLGRNISFGGDDHYFDAGRFAAHARVEGSGHSISAANDNAFPAPAVVQGLKTFTTRSNKTATVVVSGGVLSHAIIS